jgi:hypothetical protein
MRTDSNQAIRAVRQGIRARVSPGDPTNPSRSRRPRGEARRERR